MKIIFLDFDGVIRTYRSIKGKAFEGVDTECVEELNRIIATTKAKIVISSSWRGKFIAPMQKLLNSWGVKGKVVGVTPRLERFNGTIHTSATRGTEIQQWLDEHTETEAYVIIDDDTDMLDSQLDRFVLTDFQVGLTRDLAEKAIALFQNKIAPSP
jgi:predicted nucleic acid-binding protein